MTALMARGLDGLERLAADLADRPDGLAVLLHDVAEHIAQSSPLVDFWRSIERAHPAVEAADRRAVGIFLPFVHRARDAGLCRADVDEEQVLLVIDMLGSCLRGNDEAERKRLAHRSADLLMHALGMRVPERRHAMTPATRARIGRWALRTALVLAAGWGALAIYYALTGNALVRAGWVASWCAMAVAALWGYVVAARTGPWWASSVPRSWCWRCRGG